jgi:hypothetical protein
VLPFSNVIDAPNKESNQDERDQQSVRGTLRRFDWKNIDERTFARE